MKHYYYAFLNYFYLVIRDLGCGCLIYEQLFHYPSHRLNYLGMKDLARLNSCVHESDPIYRRNWIAFLENLTFYSGWET